MNRNKSIISFWLLLTMISAIFNYSYATEIENSTFDNTTRFHDIEPIVVPETNINLKIENLNRGCNIYLLLSESLLRYNMEKFINNNLENDFNSQAKIAQELKKYLDTSDYLGYIDYFRKIGFECEENEIELRHYCFCIGEQHEVIGYLDYNNTKYIQIKINLNKDNEFKLIMKDYLNNYNSLDTKFLIEEYGNETYIDLNNIGFKTSGEVKSCNVNYTYQTKEDYEAIQRATDLAYLILYIILIIILLIILILLIRRAIKKKEEKEARKFWKKRLTKEEKKEQKKMIKQLKKERKSKKKK